MSLLPWKVGGVAVGDNLDDLSINRDGSVTSRLNIGLKDAKCGVILEKMRSLLYTSCVIYGYNIQGGVLSAMPAPQEVPPNSSKPIYCHLQFCFHHSFPVSTTSNLQMYILIIIMFYAQCFERKLIVFWTS